MKYIIKKIIKTKRTEPLVSFFCAIPGGGTTADVWAAAPLPRPTKKRKKVV